MNIVVLCGGLSNEREVSISSGNAVANALHDKGHRVVLADLFMGLEKDYDDPRELFDRPWEKNIHTVGEIEPDLEKVKAARDPSVVGLVGPNVLDVCRAADIVFLALHGEEGENGKLQALLDMAEIRYTGCGYLGSAAAMNKYMTKQLLIANGIGTAQGIVLSRGENELRDVGFPCVVKPCSGGSSVGTAIVCSREGYAAAVKDAFRYEDSVLVERYVKGREFTVGVMGGRAMPVIEIIPNEGFYDYKNKYQGGRTVELCPAPISPEETDKLQKAAEAVFRALLIDVYCRVDFILDEQGDPCCLEANTLPGMTATSLIPQMAAEQGMDFGQLCEKIIAESLKKYA